MDNTIYLLHLPLGTIRAIRKAVTVLQRVGVTPEAALDIILSAHRNRHQPSKW